MTVNYTTLLGLAEPVTGTQSGTWGDDVNRGITDYLDIAIAGTQTISGTQTAVTLSITNGSSAASNIAQVASGATGSAQYQIINCTGGPVSLLTITAPASSKTYVVINATSTSQSVKLVAPGPTAGVTIAYGEKAFVVWNGSDFTKVASSTAAAAGSTTQVQYNSSGSFAGSANLTFDGTILTAAGFAGPLNGTVGATTANTGAFTTLSATGVATFSAGSAAAPALTTTGDTNTGIFFPAADTIAFSEGGAESMRIDSSGNLGVGTTSPKSIGNYIFVTTNATTGSGYTTYVNGTEASNFYANASATVIQEIRALPLVFETNATERFRVGPSGQLGIGGATYGTSGQVLTSGGASAAPTWTTPSAGGSTSIGLVRAIAINCILC